MAVPTELLQILQKVENVEAGTTDLTPVLPSNLAKTCFAFFTDSVTGKTAVLDDSNENVKQYTLLELDEHDKLSGFRDVDEANITDFVTRFVVKNDEEFATKTDSELASSYCFLDSLCWNSEPRLLSILFYAADAQLFLRKVNLMCKTSHEGSFLKGSILNSAVSRGDLAIVKILLTADNDLIKITESHRSGPRTNKPPNKSGPEINSL